MEQIYLLGKEKVINISPVNMLGFKSAQARNTQNYTQAKEVKAISPIKYASASSEAIKEIFDRHLDDTDVINILN